MVTIDISQAANLQAAIQKQLADYGYSTEDDPVMAEYVTVMLANNKSSSQITAELSDLIGPEYDAAFTDWIFDSAIPEHYSGATGSAANQTIDTPKTAVPSSGSQQAAVQNGQQQPQQQVEHIQTVGDSRDHSNRQRHNLPSRPAGGAPTGPRGSAGQGQNGGAGPQGQRGVFGTAMAGLKREGDPSLDRPNRRPRMSDGYEQNGGSQDGGQERSIFDRAGVRAGTAQPNNFMNMGGQQQQAGFGRNGPGGRRGGPPAPGFPPQQQAPPFAVPQVPGLPALHIPDNFNSLPPAQQQAIQQQIFQHQLIAAAAAQQMFQQQGPPGMSPVQPGMPFPAMQNGQQFAPQPQQIQQGQPQQQQQARKPSKPVKLPPRPTSEELCKYGVECKNAICRYSHPSPAATKESGLVLSKEVCDNGLACEDKDCPKSHVSPAQKTDPQGLNVAQYKQKAASASAPAPQPVTVHVPAANPGAKPCMFGAACTRPGCFFSHPTSAPTTTACRFGVNCTRRDCHFSHPAGRKIDNTSASFSSMSIASSPRAGGANGHASGSNFPSFTPKNMSATFSSSGAVTSSSTTAQSPTTIHNVSAGKDGLQGKEGTKIDESKMSARLKKFMEAGGSQADAERIIGGKQQDPNAATTEGDSEKPKEEDKEDDLEVVI